MKSSTKETIGSVLVHLTLVVYYLAPYFLRTQFWGTCDGVKKDVFSDYLICSLPVLIGWTALNCCVAYYRFRRKRPRDIEGGRAE
jgi:hypothetical protein